MITEKDVYGQEHSCNSRFETKITAMIDLDQNVAFVPTRSDVPGESSGVWRIWPKLGHKFSIDYKDIIKIKTR